MPHVIFHEVQMSFTPPTGDLLLGIDYKVVQSETEKRLAIPCHVWFRVMECDGKKDPQYLAANLQLDYRILPEDDDDVASGWDYAGLKEAGSDFFQLKTNVNYVHGDKKHWYVIAECRADVGDHINTSDVYEWDLS